MHEGILPHVSFPNLPTQRAKSAEESSTVHENQDPCAAGLSLIQNSPKAYLKQRGLRTHVEDKDIPNPNPTPHWVNNRLSCCVQKRGSRELQHLCFQRTQELTFFSCSGNKLFESLCRVIVPQTVKSYQRLSQGKGQTAIPHPPHPNTKEKQQQRDFIEHVKD